MDVAPHIATGITKKLKMGIIEKTLTMTPKEKQ